LNTLGVYPTLKTGFNRFFIVIYKDDSGGTSIIVPLNEFDFIVFFISYIIGSF